MARRRAARIDALPVPLVARATNQSLSTAYKRSDRWGFPNDAWGLSHAVASQFGECAASRGMLPEASDLIVLHIAGKTPEEWAAIFDEGKIWLILKWMEREITMQAEPVCGVDSGCFCFNLAHFFDVVSRAVKVELARALSATAAGNPELN